MSSVDEAGTEVEVAGGSVVLGSEVVVVEVASEWLGRVSAQAEPASRRSTAATAAPIRRIRRREPLPRVGPGGVGPGGVGPGVAGGHDDCADGTAEIGGAGGGAVGQSPICSEGPDSKLDMPAIQVPEGGRRGSGDGKGRLWFRRVRCPRVSGGRDRAAVLGPTLVSSHASSGRAPRSTSTTRVLALRVPSHGADRPLPPDDQALQAEQLDAGMVLGRSPAARS